MNVQTISRTDFYDLLWTESLKQIAVRFGVRATDIIRLSEEAGLARPPNGFWTKRAHGKAPPRPPLPPGKEGQSETLTVSSVQRVAAPRRKQASQAVAAPSQPANTAAAPPPSRSSDDVEPAARHKFVRQTAKALRGQKPVPPQQLIHRDKTTPAFNVCVRMESIDRKRTAGFFAATRIDKKQHFGIEVLVRL